MPFTPPPPPKKRKRQRISKANISFVSLCRRGANQLPGLYKADDGGVRFESMSKMGDEGRLLSLVYTPDLEDSQGHIAKAADIEKFAHSFARNGLQLDINHNQQALSKDQAYVAESFIVQPGDRRFANWRDQHGNPIDATGSWAMVTQIEDPSLRKLYREQDWHGVSLYAAPGQYDLVDEPTPLAASAAADLHQRRQNGTQTMDENTFLAALEKSNKALLAGVQAIVNPPKDPRDEAIADLKKQIDDLKKSGEPGTKEKVERTAPELPDDVTDTKAMKKYQSDLAVFELQGQHDLTTTSGLAKFNTALAKLQGDDDVDPFDVQPSDRNGDPLSLSSNYDQVVPNTGGLSKADVALIDQSIMEAGAGLDPFSVPQARQRA